MEILNSFLNIKQWPVLIVDLPSRRPQIQIWDSTKEGGKWKLGADKGSGGLWNNGPKGAPGRDPFSQGRQTIWKWNKFHITMKGNLVTVILNEKLVVDEAPLINYWDRKTPTTKESLSG